MNLNERKELIDFVFLDETGISLDANQEYFGIGGLRIGNTIEINRQLHDIFTGASSFLNQREDKFEFKFNYVTYRSLRFYRRIIEVLENNQNWTFDFIIEKKELSWENTTFWKEYLKLINVIIEKFRETKFILIADFLAKPKKEESDLSSILNNPYVLNILQLESQGSLLLQVSDILLGGISYQERIKCGMKTDELKYELSNLVLNLLKNKNEQL